eukprot:3031533-Pyramimonas_sp.AAC.1
MEVELEGKLDTPIKNKGLKGLPPSAKWVSVFTKPRRNPEDEELVCEGWIWLQQNLRDLQCTAVRVHGNRVMN